MSFEEYLKSLSLADLYALFSFISTDNNKAFGNNIETKKIVGERYKAVLDELNLRAYGKDPYRVTKIVIEGDKPEDIDLSKFEEK